MIELSHGVEPAEDELQWEALRDQARAQFERELEDKGVEYADARIAALRRLGMGRRADLVLAARIKIFGVPA
jgi:hypothetical protein